MDIINTNIASIVAQNNLSGSQSTLQTAMQRLSSGLRINSAADDAAGYAISQRMTAQIGGLDQAGRNANDGISLAQTAQGALSQITTNLQTVRNLAVQAANGTNSASDRASLNNEASQLIAENNQIAQSSNFNGVNLLDGSFTGESFQVGANSSSENQINVNQIGSALSSSLGVGTNSSYVATVAGTTVNSSAFSAGDLIINGFQVGASSSDNVSSSNAASSGIAKANAINAITAETGVTATVSATNAAGVAPTSSGATAAGDVLINGVDIGPLAAATSTAARGAQVASAINAISSQTGVTATATTAGIVSLTAADGRNITVTGTSTGSANTGLADTTTTSNITLTSSSTGGVATATGVAPTSTAATAAGDVVINGVDIGAQAATSSNALEGAEYAAAINSKSSQTNVTASVDSTGVLTLTSTNGKAFTVTTTANGAGSTGLTSGTTTYTQPTTGITLASGGGTGNGLTEGGFASGFTSATQVAGAGISSLNLTTVAGAQSAISTIDAALTTLNNSSAALGALQNRFQSAVANLSSESQNAQTSRARIQDTDFASTTAQMTQAQVLQQAGTAILAQANALPNGVLALLR